MSEVFGAFRPNHPRAGEIAFQATYAMMRLWMKRRGIHTERSFYAGNLFAGLKHRLSSGEPLYFVGVNATEHNTGASLVEVSRDSGIRILGSEEEERYRGIKHYAGYPTESLKAIRRRLHHHGIAAQSVTAFCGGYDYAAMLPAGIQTLVEHLPQSLPLLRRDATTTVDAFSCLRFPGIPKEVQLHLELAQTPRVVLLNHHDNHAAFSYAVSPFRNSPDPVVVAVLDGYGEREAISIHVGQNGHLRRVWSNQSLIDSLGLFYSVISSTQGGWTALSSEGRYMGAAAWGDGDRLTNPWYRPLREMFHFRENGEVFLNRRLGQWHLGGQRRPYSRRLEQILGPPVPLEKMWNPDAVLRVDDISHPELTRERVDKAAAAQLVFEDVMFHVAGHALRAAKSDKLILTGGTALNCVCNMRLLEKFDCGWYRRYCGMDTRLQLWVPPVPGDAGIPLGAAYNLALKVGARPVLPLEHAFHCGFAPGRDEIEQALAATTEIGSMRLDGLDLESVADFVASVLSRDGVIGLFQGSAEIGPRALGHRSILANPANPATLDMINRRVKYREALRPLAPMVTLKAAHRLFHLSDGAAAEDYSAYDFMVLTARAKEEAMRLIPAVVHRDGTSRLQIVRPEVDRFSYQVLEGMGRRIGVEAAVNTSLNVGSPIVQTPEQALGALKRARGMSGLIMIAEETAWLAWHAVENDVNDAGKTIRRLYSEWRSNEAPPLRRTSNTVSNDSAAR